MPVVRYFQRRQSCEFRVELRNCREQALEKGLVLTMSEEVTFSTLEAKAKLYCKDLVPIRGLVSRHPAHAIDIALLFRQKCVFCEIRLFIVESGAGQAVAVLEVVRGMMQNPANGLSTFDHAHFRRHCLSIMNRISDKGQAI